MCYYIVVIHVLTSGFFALLGDLYDDAGVCDDDDDQGDEVEEGDAEDVVHHLAPREGLEEAEGHTLVEVRMVRVGLHVEHHALRGKRRPC